MIKKPTPWELDEEDNGLGWPENLADVWHNRPVLNDQLIQGVLRKGHKMLVAGPSKAGKSFSLIELCIAISNGLQWMGHFQCAKGKVLYVNFELDERSCLACDGNAPGVSCIPTC